MSLGRDGNMDEMPGPYDPHGFFVEWQLADDAASGTPFGLVDLSAEESEDEVVVTDDVGIHSISGS
jgi:hypothetical protein